MTARILEFVGTPCPTTRCAQGSASAPTAGTRHPLGLPAPSHTQPASAVDDIVAAWLANLSTTKALPAPAGGLGSNHMQPLTWADKIRRHGTAAGNTEQQIDQAVDRAKMLMQHGQPEPIAIIRACAGLDWARQINADEETFLARKHQIVRGLRHCVERC